jgi:hypothetical protein
MTHIMLATNLDSYHRTTVMPDTKTKILIMDEKKQIEPK